MAVLFCRWLIGERRRFSAGSEFTDLGQDAADLIRPSVLTTIINIGTCLPTSTYISSNFAAQILAMILVPALESLPLFPACVRCFGLGLASCPLSFRSGCLWRCGRLLWRVRRDGSPRWLWTLQTRSPLQEEDRIRRRNQMNSKTGTTRLGLCRSRASNRIQVRTS